jgi:hypothetical protein
MLMAKSPSQPERAGRKLTERQTRLVQLLSNSARVGLMTGGAHRRKGDKLPHLEMETRKPS